MISFKKKVKVVPICLCLGFSSSVFILFIFLNESVVVEGLILNFIISKNLYCDIIIFLSHFWFYI